MNQMKSIFKKIGLSCLAILLVANTVYGSVDSGEDFCFLENTPFYSFTDKIEYYTLSKNNEKIVIQVNSKQTSLKKLYLTNANGTGLTDIFSDGEWSLKQYGLYLEMKHLKPVISGNGEVLVQGVIPTQQVDKKSDYLFIYYPKTKKNLVISLKVLFPGCTIARFPKSTSGFQYSLDFNGNKIFACIEMGTQSNKCEVFETVIISMNSDGSNQMLVYGPNDYSPIHCRFTWKNYPKSPKNPIASYNGDKIFFFGSVYESNESQEKSGDIFVMNADGTNLRQLTFSKRLDPKPELAGPFITNYYGSRLYYQIQNNDRFDLVSIGMDGSLPETYFSFSSPIIFSISTDGKKIFFAYPEKNNSFVYFDVVTQRMVTLLDFTKPAEKTNYGLFSRFSVDDIIWTNTCDFSGGVFLFCLDQEWLLLGKINTAYLRPSQMNVLFQVNFPVVTVNHQLISLPVSPYLKNNRIMIPATVFFQSFGYPYKWYSKEQVMEAKQFGNVFQINLNQKTLAINGKIIKTAVNAEISNNQLFIPGYWTKDYFGLSISWDSKLQALTIRR